MNHDTYSFSDLVREPPAWLLVLLGLFIAGNLLGLIFFPPHTDEAYYWMLSQHPALSYFDHPPLIPWMIYIFSGLLGNAEWSFRLPAVIAWLSTAWVVFRLAAELAGERRAGWTALLVFASLPVFQAGFHIVGPDSGLMLATSLALLFSALAVQRQAAGWWILAGLATGAGMLAKYNMVLVPATIFVALLINTHARRVLRTPWPWLAGIVALLVFSPVLVWNHANDWISFAFQWQHGTVADTGTWYGNLFFYVINQLGVVLPWVFVAMVIVAVRSPAADGSPPFTLTLMQTGFWLPLLFFAGTGLLTKGHASWPAMAYIPGSILLGVALTRWLGPDPKTGATSRRRVKTVTVALALVSLFIVNLLRFPLQATAIGLGPLPNSQASNGMGWHEIARDLKQLQTEQARQLASTTACRIIALPGYDNDGFPYYLMAAEIGLHLRDADAVTAAPGYRLTQFDYWRKQETGASPPLCIAVIGPYNKKQMPARLDNDLGGWKQYKTIAIDTPEGGLRYFGFYVADRDQANSSTMRR